MTKMIYDIEIHPDSMRQKAGLFQSVLSPYMLAKRRDLPWRHLSEDVQQRFYEVLVSELMLQQTQVVRVVDRYISWMDIFPCLSVLSNAPFNDVLMQWQGLGYSRRARYLHEIAKELERSASIPTTTDELIKFKGIGPNTAASVVVYTFNVPEVFIETNVRSVLFHHFFSGAGLVSDSELRALMSLLVPQENSREWYWALMDYGTDLKKSVKNIQQSKHYKKQSPFKGSDRQLRAGLLRELLKGPIPESYAIELVGGKKFIVDALIKERMIVSQGGILAIPD